MLIRKILALKLSQGIKMQGFNFEKNLPHQEEAVKAVIEVFDGIELQDNTVQLNKNYINPTYNRLEKSGNSWNYIIQPWGKLAKNITQIQNDNHIHERPNSRSNIIDIMMETGTGKTYTYTKTMFELNKQLGVFKFIIVVPTLSIKAGTINFLRSESSREHFKEQYGKILQLHIVESKKSSKNKKITMPQALTSFVDSGVYEKNSIQVMVINTGMINSDTMQKSFDKGLFDKYTIPFDAVAATKPWLIIDEPHKFDHANKTWDNIQKMQPQFILRYGATFPDKELKQRNVLTNKDDKILVKDYHNLVYQLRAVDAFNNNLVKGIIGYITEFDDGKNATVEFIGSNGIEATFKLNDNLTQISKNLKKGDCLELLHHAMSGLSVDNLNKSTVVLSNGLEMKKGDKINPYSYAETLQETMIRKAIKQHFEIEKLLIKREVKIKPLTLFFIDNIDEYRRQDGYIRLIVEQSIQAEINEQLKIETDIFYKKYLEDALVDVSKTHAGYFSKDNNEKDEVIEKEINEILHDKQAILSLNNPRRFIFSKWTLREGWDNPNVFQICKLRSSGSEISKLQEVGRGLRLPVNEYGNRVKDEQFSLNYFVDFTESDFIDKLVSEINQKSGAVSPIQDSEKLTALMIKQIFDKYGISEDRLLEILDNAEVIKRNNSFKDGGFEYMKTQFPRIFEGVDSSKIRKSTDAKKKITLRTSKYSELKELWEKLNQKVILEYKFANENDFKVMLVDFLSSINKKLSAGSISLKTSTLVLKENEAFIENSSSVLDQSVATLSTIKYSKFLQELAKLINVNIDTLHKSFIATNIDINKYLNQTTMRIIKQEFEFYLMANAIDKFSIEYKKVSNSIHPTKLTNKNGVALEEVNASDVGIFSSNEEVANTYLFNELHFDSELEKRNIQQNINEVIVFTKIPKNSIKIPIAGGKTYSPDFAYVIKYNNGKQKLNFIVETKDVESSNSLRDEEMFKIKHAEKFFDNDLKIKFVAQFKVDEITTLIKENILTDEDTSSQY